MGRTWRRGARRTAGTVAAALVAAAAVLGAGAGSAAASAPPRAVGASGAAPVVGAVSAGTSAVSAAPLLSRGSSGPAVLAVQQRLSALGYWHGADDGAFGALTEQAVLALQGAAGLGRDGVVGPLTRRALDAGVRPAASTRTGHAIEIDRGAGLLLVVDDGRVSTVLHTSTGTFEWYTYGGQRYLADTPAGTFHVTWVYDGWQAGPLGQLYRPRYFHPDGIAVHGYPSVPAYPASHGCARVSLAAMDLIWARGLMPLGSTVVVR